MTDARSKLGQRRIIVADVAMARVFELLKRLAASELPVLVLGETRAWR